MPIKISSNIPQGLKVTGKARLSKRSEASISFWAAIGTPEFILNFLVNGVMPPVVY